MAETKKAAGKEVPAKETETKSAVVKEEAEALVKTAKKPGRKPKEAAETSGAAKKTAAAKTTRSATAAKASKTTKATKTATAGRAAKAVKTAKAAITKVEEAVYFEFGGKKYTPAELVKICKDVWMYDLNGKEEDFKSVELYVKPEENTTYYVINGDVTGSFMI